MMFGLNFTTLPRTVTGLPVNRKRVRRLYRLDGLQLRTRIRRRKHMCLHFGPVPVPSAPHERWGMDFVHDQLFDGRPFRILTVADQLSRERPLIEVDPAMSGQRDADSDDPHSSPGHLTPGEFVRNRRDNRARKSAEL